MLITVFVVVYCLIFSSIFKARKLSEDSAVMLVLFCLPWIVFEMSGTYWAFIKDPPDYVPRMSELDYFATWLLIAAMAAVPLSYIAAYRIGSESGYREGQSQTRRGLSPMLLSTGEIGLYRYPDDCYKEGGELIFGGQRYIINSIHPTEGLLYLVAERKPSEAKGGKS